MHTSQKLFDFELFFRALSDRTRLRLLHLIDGKEVCVCFFVEILGSSQPKISRHLAYLRKAGLARGRREGKWMHYQLVEPTNPYAQQILIGLRQWFNDEPQMQRDREKLRAVGNMPLVALSPTRRRASLPDTIVTL
jgi:ArsR family transcriptional regulator, arsenate/arsenite/antimonite-responsive transcriptional repressor